MINQPEYFIRPKDEGETLMGVFHIVKKSTATHIATFYTKTDAEEYVLFMLAKMEIITPQE